jgi:hypothetical protein
MVKIKLLIITTYYNILQKHPVIPIDNGNYKVFSNLRHKCVKVDYLQNLCFPIIFINGRENIHLLVDFPGL